MVYIYAPAQFIKSFSDSQSLQDEIKARFDDFPPPGNLKKSWVIVELSKIAFLTCPNSHLHSVRRVVRLGQEHINHYLQLYAEEIKLMESTGRSNYLKAVEAFTEGRDHLPYLELAATYKKRAVKEMTYYRCLLWLQSEFS